MTRGGTNKARVNTPGTTTKASPRALSVGLGQRRPQSFQRPARARTAKYRHRKMNVFQGRSLPMPPNYLSRPPAVMHPCLRRCPLPRAPNGGDGTFLLVTNRLTPHKVAINHCNRNLVHPVNLHIFPPPPLGDWWLCCRLTQGSLCSPWALFQRRSAAEIQNSVSYGGFTQRAVQRCSALSCLNLQVQAA